MGVTVLENGDNVGPEEVITPCFRAMPMGVSFSLWVCQRVMETISQRAALVNESRLLVDRQAPPNLSKDFGHTSYVDNFVALSQHEALATSAAERVFAELKRSGFLSASKEDARIMKKIFKKV